ncbi:hypothetical protein MAM1_0029d02301 [Mucor ambiguus]|uniref:Uncharacterized protein n=1 Tax=Mucor ambiguus TaxID=91626 RepID=A0A0C9MLW5_9FUNG|nr:hypothetical protein MAM1_0029d02301 [Mucor ambiguus]
MITRAAAIRVREEEEVLVYERDESPNSEIASSFNKASGLIQLLKSSNKWFDDALVSCLVVFYFILIVHATDSAEDCDEDDLECLEDFTTTTSASFITSSLSSFGEPLSTVSAAGTPDVLSDFHEAKLVNPKPDPNHPGGRKERLPAKQDGGQAGSVQDKYNQDQDIDSGSAGLGETIDESTATGLSKVEAGVLSACGILVVAGIAVGIFVWKNTTKRRNLRDRDMSMADLEYNHDSDMGGGDPMAVKSSIITTMPKAVLEPSIKSQQRFNDDMQSVKSNTTNNSESLAMIQKQLQQELEEEERLQLQQLKQQPIINLTLPAFERDEDDFFTSWEQCNSKLSSTSTTSLPQQIPEQLQPSFQLSKLITSKDAIISANKTQAVEVVYDETEQNDIIQPNSIAAAHVSSTHHTPDVGKEYEMADLSPSLQANTANARPSATDPLHDPTAITYPLQKFLNTPTQSFKSPVQIPVELGNSLEEEDEEGEEEDHPLDNTVNKLPLDKDAFGATYDIMIEKPAGSSSVHNLNQQLNKIFRHPENAKPTASTPHTAMVDIDLSDTPMAATAASKSQRALEKSPLKETEPGKQPFLSPLDLPDDQYIPMRDAAGPPLVSRAQVLADPVRRLGQDEIALWEQNCRKKGLKQLSYEMWDEQILRDQIEENDRKHIANYYGTAMAAVAANASAEQQQDNKMVP